MPTKYDNVLSWATDLDDKTLEQAERSARLPFIYKHVALMPDAHFGYGATVGSVIPTKGAVIPSAVGVDIGCGMIAAKLNLTANDLPDDLAPLHSQIQAAVPAGVGKGHMSEANMAGQLSETYYDGQSYWNDKMVKQAVTQFGSLGSGNHFIEVCLDESDDVWVVLHSGSRGIGNRLANIHIDGAKDLMKKYFIEMEDLDLAYLVEGTTEFNLYITDMLWAQDYAMGNRQKMMDLIMAEIVAFMGRPVQQIDLINCHHNFTERENHMGQNVWVTRKGAIRAREGDRGVIPGSMGAASYIVSGAGHPASFCSCSHGAGRKMSRAAARKQLDREGLVAAMEGKAWNNDVENLIDEDPRAYKNIDEVMEAQRDLVTVEHTLRQILNYKGV